MANGEIATKPATQKRKIFRMLLTLVGLYVLICVGGCALQRRLIYFPTKLDPNLAEIMASRSGFLPWKNQSNQIIGWKLPSAAHPTGCVLIVHGNAGCAVDREYLARPIHDTASVDVYILEYPGYGARDGSPSMKTFLAAADEAFALLSESGPIYIVSESLGTGVATHLASTHGRKVGGLTLFVPYNNFVSLAQEKMPFLPVSMILLDRFDPETWLKDYSGPVQFVVAENDEVIPAKFGLRLHDGYSGPKSLQVVKGAHHNDVAAQSSEWWKNIFLFWQESNQPDSTRKPGGNP